MLRFQRFCVVFWISKSRMNIPMWSIIGCKIRKSCDSKSYSFLRHWNNQMREGVGNKNERSFYSFICFCLLYEVVVWIRSATWLTNPAERTFKLMRIVGEMKHTVVLLRAVHDCTIARNLTSRATHNFHSPRRFQTRRTDLEICSWRSR